MAAYLRHSARGGVLSPKDAALPEKITQEQERLLQLSNEKVACAERILHLLNKAMGRLDVDLARAMDRTGEAISQDTSMGMTGGSRTLLEKLPDTLRGALQDEGKGSIVLSTPGASSTSTPHPPTKRTLGILYLNSYHHLMRFRLVGRRMNSTAPTGSPAPGVDASHAPAGRSRLSVIHARPASPVARSRRATSELVKDVDADGEDDPDDPSGGDPEDKTLYCTCQSLSYGKMVLCENDSCPYQWVSGRLSLGGCSLVLWFSNAFVQFHLACVGLQDPLPKHWFCPSCLEKHGPALTGGTTSGERRRRRK